MKLRQTLMLAVFLAVLMLETIGHAERSSMIQDVGIGQEETTRWDCSGKWYVTCAEYQGWTDIVTIGAGFGRTVGRKADGTVVAVGCNSDGQCNIQP